MRLLLRDLHFDFFLYLCGWFLAKRPAFISKQTKKNTCIPRCRQCASRQNRKKTNMKRIALLLLLIFSGWNCAKTQIAAIKTNLIYDATASVNLGFEFGLAKHWTLDINGNLNMWNISGLKKWRHWFAQPEARFWFCDKFNGHFLGFHAVGGQYNIGGTRLVFNAFPETKTARFEGWGAGIGIAYGYQWLLSKNWSIEASVGIGYIYSMYDKFPCATCGTLIGEGAKHYFGPTKASLSVIYIMK